LRGCALGGVGPGVGGSFALLVRVVLRHGGG
jgi:hypothetical protein